MGPFAYVRRVIYALRGLTRLRVPTATIVYAPVFVISSNAYRVAFVGYNFVRCLDYIKENGSR